MAACSWIAARFDCTASIELRDDGTARVASASQDIGTGTYTVMAQMVADTLGIAIERVEVEIGDSSLPTGRAVRRLDAHGVVDRADRVRRLRRPAKR